MPDEFWKRYKNAFEVIGIILASVGSIIPGFSYFTTYLPPIWQGASILTTAIAAGVIIIIYFYTPQGLSEEIERRFPVYIRRAIVCLSLSIVLLIVYAGFLSYCTILSPDGTQRYQIGFYKSDWSLTDEGKEVKKMNPNQTPKDWMLNDALFKEDGPSVIWTMKSIITAGLIMIVTYLISFVLWAAGWSLIAKQISIQNPPEP